MYVFLRVVYNHCLPAIRRYPSKEPILVYFIDYTVKSSNYFRMRDVEGEYL
jgi:hypothetical protein